MKILVRGIFCVIADANVVGLEIIVNIAYFVNLLKQGGKLDSDLPDCLVREQFALSYIDFILKTAVEPVNDKEMLLILLASRQKNREILNFVLV